jgi:hypothetical protein
VVSENCETRTSAAEGTTYKDLEATLKAGGVKTVATNSNTPPRERLDEFAKGGSFPAFRARQTGAGRKNAELRS